MKKLTKILMGIALLVSGFMFTGCGDEVTGVLAGPTNTWCKMPVSYNDDSSSTTSSLYAYFYYATSDKKIGTAELKKGLNLVVTANGTTQISGLTNSAYILKNFNEDGETSISDSSTDTEVLNVCGNRAKWSAIYWAKDDLRNKSNQSTTAPSQVRSGEAVSVDTLSNFSLKNLLRNYLLTALN